MASTPPKVKNLLGKYIPYGGSFEKKRGYAAYGGGKGGTGGSFEREFITPPFEIIIPPEPPIVIPPWPDPYQDHVSFRLQGGSIANLGNDPTAVLALVEGTGQITGGIGLGPNGEDALRLSPTTGYAQGNILGPLKDFWIGGTIEAVMAVDDLNNWVMFGGTKDEFSLWCEGGWISYGIYNGQNLGSNVRLV